MYILVNYLQRYTHDLYSKEEYVMINGHLIGVSVNPMWVMWPYASNNVAITDINYILLTYVLSK